MTDTVTGIEKNQGDIGAGEVETRLPTETLGAVAGTLRAPTAPARRPVWLHTVYLRNWDFDLSDDQKKAVVSDRQRLDSTLNRDSLSPFRYRIYPVAYGPAGCGELTGSIASTLLSYFQSFPAEVYDLCDLASTGADGLMLEHLATSIHRAQQRLILSRSPHLETLSFRARGVELPREDLRLDPVTNEITLIQTAASTIAVGDPIEVAYEPR